MGRQSPLTSVAGAVLAGGSSSRMGSDKALLQFQGETLLSRIARVLTHSGCDPVVLVGKQPFLKHQGWPVLDQESGPAHPLSGMIHTLRHFQPRPVLFCAVDMPAVTPKHVQLLLAMQRPCVAVSTEHGHSLLCLLNQEQISIAEQIVHQHGRIQDLFAGLARIELPRAALVNCNTPQDLASLGHPLEEIK